MVELLLGYELYLLLQVCSGAHGRTMIFTRTKAEANELALSSSLKQDCQVLHGDIQQKQREITLKVQWSCKYMHYLHVHVRMCIFCTLTFDLGSNPLILIKVAGK